MSDFSVGDEVEYVGLYPKWRGTTGIVLSTGCCFGSDKIIVKTTSGYGFKEFKSPFGYEFSKSKWQLIHSAISDIPEPLDSDLI